MCTIQKDDHNHKITRRLQYSYKQLAIYRMAQNFDGGKF